MRYAGKLDRVPTSRLVRDAATLIRNFMSGSSFGLELARRADLLELEARDARERCADFHRVGCPCDVLKRIGEGR